MLSRVAENLYWMGRYIERAENLARLLDDAFHLELDTAVLGGPDGEQGPVERVLTILSCRDEFGQSGAGTSRNAVLRYLTFDRRHAHSILSMIARARENARGTQETLSSEAWGQVNRLYLYLSGPRAQRRFQASPFRFYESIKRGCVLFDGIVVGTLPRTEVYHFLQLGRCLERIDQLSRILNLKIQTLAEGQELTDLPWRSGHWISLLRSCSAYESYLRRHREQVEPRNVVRYLLLDPDSPRTIRFSLSCCLASLHELTGGEGDGFRSEPERLLGRLDGELRYMDLEEIVARGLFRFLTEIQQTCARVDREIHQTYFLS
jgi:uncharacterized alpha-E superfamily protein